jgi:hypothetical protein
VSSAKAGAQAALLATRQRCHEDPAFWTFDTGYVLTRDEHDRDSPVKPFPDLPYLRFTLTEWHTGPKLQYVAKSRQLMISWLLAAYGLWTPIHRPASLVLWQSKKEQDAAKMVYRKSPLQARMSFMLANLPSHMQYCVMRVEKSGKLVCAELAEATGEVTERMRRYFNTSAADGNLIFPNGAEVLSLAQGADQVESSVPTLFISDEASLQDEWRSSQAAAQPAIDGDARGITVGTMRLPSDYGEEVSPCAEIDPDNIMRGVARFRSREGVASLRIHYSADPDKDPLTPAGQLWKARQLASGAYEGGELGWRWQQHLEINPEARGGKAVLPALLDDRARSRIVIAPIPFDRRSSWSYASGLDWGARNNAVWLIKGTDPLARRYLVHELSAPGSEIGGIKGMCDQMKKHPLFGKLNGKIQSDPSLWNEDQNQDSGGLVSKAALFARYGVHLQPAASKGQQADEVLTDRLLYYYWAGWEESEFSPLLMIFNTCANTIRNLQRLRYDEYSEALRASRQQKETMRDLHTDEWDACKYEEVQWHDIPKYIAPEIVGSISWHRRQHARESAKPSGDVFGGATRGS